MTRFKLLIQGITLAQAQSGQISKASSKLDELDLPYQDLEPRESYLQIRIAEWSYDGGRIYIEDTSDWDIGYDQRLMHQKQGQRFNPDKLATGSDLKEVVEERLEE